MDPTMQAGGIGILAKIAVDVLRAVFPKIQARWVHAAVLVLCLGYGGYLAYRSPDSAVQAVTNALTAFLAAIGVNEVTRKRVWSCLVGYVFQTQSLA